MKPRSLLVAAIVLAALSGVVWWAKRHPQTPSSSTTSSSPKIVEIADNQVKEIDLTKKNGPAIVVQKQSGKWTITAPAQYAADQDSVSGVVSSLSPVTGDSVVEDHPSDIGKYGLNTPTLIVNIVKNDGKADKLTFGDDLPAGSLVYAQHGSDPKVYAVSSSVKSSFDKSLNDIRDKRLMTFDSNKLTGVELAAGKTQIDFAKNGQNEWQIVKPKPYRADNFQVEELLRKLTDAKMDLSGSAEDTKKADALYASGQSVGIAKVSDASGPQNLEIRKNKDEYYAKSSVVQGAYKVSADLGKELGKPLDEFRNKKLFDFGFSDPNKLAIQQSGNDKVYTKSGSDWKLNGKSIDASSIQAFIDKLRDLSATKFEETGFTTPVLDLAVTSNEGKRVEKVSFAKATDGYIAKRENEPALYQVDAKAVDDILRASSDIKESAPHSKK